MKPALFFNVCLLHVIYGTPSPTICRAANSFGKPVLDHEQPLSFIDSFSNDNDNVWTRYRDKETATVLTLNQQNFKQNIRQANVFHTSDYAL